MYGISSASNWTMAFSRQICRADATHLTLLRINHRRLRLDADHSAHSAMIS
jgi:hypothetical protein